MDTLILIALLVCAAGGVIAELFTLAVPEKILGVAERDPQEVVGDRLFRLVFILSGLYLCAIVLMFVSGIEMFRLHATILVIMSLAAWLFRRILLRIRALQVAESTVCLIVLLDTMRSILRVFHS